MEADQAGLSLGERLRAVLLIVGCVVLTFANSLENSFHYDDEHSLIGNRHIRDIGNFHLFFINPQLFSRNLGSEMYRPLVLVSYAVNYALDRYRVQGYHLLNIGIHLASACLLYLLLTALGSGHKAALVGVLLFAVHPLAAEPVNYISSRSESLAAAFILLGLLLYVRHGGRFSVGAWFAFVAALCSKESAIVFPGILLIYEWLWCRRAPAVLLRRLLPYGLVAVAYVWGMQRLLLEAVVEAPVRPWMTQLITQIKALVYYGKLLVVPHPLSVDHPFEISVSLTDAAVICSGTLVGSLLWIVGNRRGSRVFWLLTMGLALLPTCLVPLNVLVNERRLYLVLAAFVGLLVWVCSSSRCHQTLRIPVVVALLFLLLMTVQRNWVWATPKSLWTDAQRLGPDLVRPHLRLGVVYRRAGEDRAAEASFRRALVLDPNNAPAYNNLGVLYTSTADYAKAETAYRRALDLVPHYGEALINLATLYGKYLRRPRVALDLYERARPLVRDREEFHNNLAIAYLNLGRFTEAEAALRRALALTSDGAMIYFNLGGALEGQGRMAEALLAYDRAVQLDPGYSKAYYRCGLLLQASGRLAAARQAFENCLEGDVDAELAAAAKQRLVSLMVLPVIEADE